MFDDTPATSEINPHGLTYRRKPSRSLFTDGSGLQGQAMSCLQCGQHRPRLMLRSRLLAGRHHAVRAPSCKALASAQVAGRAHLLAGAGK